MMTAEEIRALRLKLRMSAREFGELLGAKDPSLAVTEDAVYRWEMGDRHPSWKRMERLNELADQVGAMPAIS